MKKLYPFLCVCLCAAGCATYHTPVRPASSVPDTSVPAKLILPPMPNNLPPTDSAPVSVSPQSHLSEEVLSPNRTEFHRLLHKIQHKVVACLNTHYGSSYVYKGSGYVKVPNKHICWNRLSSWVSDQENNYSGAQQSFLQKTADWMHVCYRQGSHVCFQSTYTQKLKKYKEYALSH